MFHLKVGGKYVAWNSFEMCWYLGDFAHGELFSDSDAHKCPDLRRALDAYPAAKVVAASVCC